MHERKGDGGEWGKYFMDFGIFKTCNDFLIKREKNFINQ